MQRDLQSVPASAVFHTKLHGCEESTRDRKHEKDSVELELVRVQYSGRRDPGDRVLRRVTLVVELNVAAAPSHSA